MKKLLVATTVIMLVGMLIVSACSASVPRTTQAPQTTAAAPTATQAPWTTAYVPQPTAAPYYPTTTRPAMTTPAATYYNPTAAPTPTAPWAYPYPPVTTTPSSGTIGLSAGGAKDIANFRENIRNRYLPLPTDVTYEGLFYDYYFDTGMTEPSNKLFSPSYSFAATRDPFSRQTEYYLSVGLNSGMKESDFQRKKLNLVIVLDSSGSMGEDFNQYYYDGRGQRIDAYDGEGIHRLRKMDSANESVVAILDQLEYGDRFAIVQFDSSAVLAQPMGLVSNTDMRYVKNKVLDINAGGSTNLAAGIDMATSLFRNLREVSSYEYENRMIILTDAQPNTGDINSSDILNKLKNNASGRIYTTFIGIGVDFNSQLVEEITKTKGANYYSVHSPREFRQRVNEEFDFMVTPLVFNLQLRFESKGWRIEKVFGSPQASEASGELMKINTMFPSKSEGGETRGGLVLLKLRKTSNSPEEPVYLKASYEDRNGRSDSSSVTITPETTRPEYFDNSGIRKGVLLSRYAALLQNWMIDERQHLQFSRPWDPSIREDTGIILPVINVSQWERQSISLTVSEPWRKIFRDFSGYFEGEMRAINDNDLAEELGILNLLGK